jgi:hypothetical protein
MLYYIIQYYNITVKLELQCMHVFVTPHTSPPSPPATPPHLRPPPPTCAPSPPPSAGVLPGTLQSQRA